MKSIILSYSDLGGAGRAAINICKSLNNLNINSEIFVKKKFTNLSLVKNFYKKNNFIFEGYRERINRNICKLEKKNIFSYQSPSIFPTFVSKKLNVLNYDIIHLCWINEFLNIDDIGKIKKPIICTLCDMWPFSGVNHYEDYNYKVFWRKNFFDKFDKFSIDKWLIKRKLKSWKSPMNIVVPNKWMFDCVKDSKIMSNFECHIIKWPINENIFFMKNKIDCRKKFGLNINKKIILFGSSNGLKDRRKGWDYLNQSLSLTKENFDLIILGSKKPENFSLNLKGNIFFFEKLANDEELSDLYNSVDCLALPSLHDNTPLISQEAQMCGVPIVLFDHNGMSEIVDHKVNGYKAKSLDVSSFANGIDWILKSYLKENLSEKALIKSQQFNFQKIGLNYVKLYKEVLKLE